jgi:hypothetical protein
MTSLRSAAPKTKTKAGSGRHTIVWIVGAMIVAILAFIGLKRFIWSPDPAANATQTIADRNSTTAEAAPTNFAKANYCTTHADDPDPFPSWYCAEFRPWAQKIEARESATSSDPLLWVAVVFLMVFNCFVWWTKKDKEP